MPTYLYGPLKPDFRQPLVLKVNYAHPGQFRVRVDSVSTLARLVFLLDGALPLVLPDLDTDKAVCLLPISTSKTP